MIDLALEAESPSPGGRHGAALVVVHLEVRPVDRPLHAGRDGREHDGAARVEVLESFGRELGAEVLPEIGRPDQQRANARRCGCDLACGEDAARRLGHREQGHRPRGDTGVALESVEARGDVVDVVGAVDHRDRDQRDARERTRKGVEVGIGQPAAQPVDADADERSALGRCQRALARDRARGLLLDLAATASSRSSITADVASPNAFSILR